MRLLAPFLVVAGLCLAAAPQVGRPAPPLTLRQVLQAPGGVDTTWQGLKGDAVVVEFWATWCGGCRDQIPHLNRLAEQFRGKPVRFISVTDEEPVLVERFLKEYPIAGWIGIDAGGRTFTEWEINGRPRTVLVDAAGVVRGIGPPADLTGETMENFLAGRPIVFSDEGVRTNLQAMPDPIFQVLVRPAAPVAVSGYSSGAVSGKAGQRWETWGVPLRRLLSDAYEIPEERIEAPAWASERESAYDVAIAAPGLTPERQRELLQRGLQETFQLKARKASRETGVYVLRRSAVGPKLKAAAPNASSHWGKDGALTAVAVPATWLAATAQRVLGKPVIDETGLQGRFDFELTWEVGKPASFLEAVRAQLGLELAEVRRPLEYLVIESAVQPRTW